MAKKKPQSAEPLIGADLPCVVRDPANFLADTRPVEQPQLKLAMGLDLGLKTGFAAAYFDPRQPFDLARTLIWSGQLDLSIGHYESRAVSGLRLTQFLFQANPAVVFFEDVKHTPRQGPSRLMASIIAQATSAAEFFGGLKMTVSQWAEQACKPAVEVGIGDIKRRATMRGNANKADIIRAYNALFSTNFDPLTYEQTGVDNMCDATFALIFGLEHYGNGVAGDGP